MGESLGKLLAVAIDALTPRSVRMLILALACLNGYGWWLHDKRLEAEERALVEFQKEATKQTVQLEFISKSMDEGNAELKAIRQLLMQRGR